MFADLVADENNHEINNNNNNNTILFVKNLHRFQFCFLCHKCRSSKKLHRRLVGFVHTPYFARRARFGSSEKMKRREKTTRTSENDIFSYLVKQIAYPKRLGSSMESPRESCLVHRKALRKAYPMERPTVRPMACLMECQTACRKAQTTARPRVDQSQ
jgi:hypothetical protein